MPFRPLQETQLSLGNLQEEMNRLLSRIWHSGVSTGPFDGQHWAPLFDLYERDEYYTLYAEIPGVDGESIELSHLGQTLTIRGEKVRPEEVGEGNRALNSERRYGAFCRTVELPGDIYPDKMSASCGNGVLRIIIPKSESSRPKAIKIDVVDG